MFGRLLRIGVLAAVLALIVTAFAAQSPEIMAERAKLKAQTQPRRTGAIESRFNLPRADGRRELDQIRSSSRSVSILDDSRRRSMNSLKAMSPVSLAALAQIPVVPPIAICGDGTTYDYQHNDLGQKQIATLGGDPSNTNVHFVWTHWEVVPDSEDQIDRFVNYNGFNAGTGLCLGDCGVTISGAGGDPLLARAGYVTLGLSSGDNATAFLHQRDEVEQGNGSAGIYSSWAIQQGIPCFNLFADFQIEESETNELIWPHGRVDRNGSEADDVWHVCSHATGDQGLGDEMVYWRKVGVAGTWEGPVNLGENSGALNYLIATDPTSEKVAIIYNQDHLDPENLQHVVYLESTTNGADWTTPANVALYPDPVPGLVEVQVTNYLDPDGAQAWTECGGDYDFAGNLHVYWVEQAFTNVTGDARLRHWSSALGFSTVAQAIGWENQAGDGARDIVLAFPGIGFGDGQTQCNDGPPNPGIGGANTNLNYVYYLWEQYGGETPVEQADFATSSNQMNLEVYLATSNDGGATWSPPTNLTSTKTPGCDGTSGNECASERDPFIAYVINDAIHVMYILDTEAGDAPQSQGAWTFNPVLYLKIPGGTDADLVCPQIAPSFQARITNAVPDCEFNTTYDPAGTVNEDLLLENFGNATMTGNISGFSADWLTVAGGGYSVAAGGSDSRAVSMNAGAGSIQSGGEGLYQDVISVTHNDPSRPSPRDINVDFFVFNDFACPDYVVMHTGDNGAKGAQGNNGTLWMEISNVGRNVQQHDEDAGMARLGSDSSWSLYDGSLIIGVPPSPDTLVYRNIFGSGKGQPGFRALSALEIDTISYGTNSGSATAFANETTVDSTIGIDVTYIFPQAADSSEFILIKYKIFNRSGSDINDLIIGEALDFDINPRPDSLDDLQAALQNTGHIPTGAGSGYNLIYQQGSDSLGHAIVGDVTATRFKAGITSIQCVPAPRAWIAPNGILGDGFGEGYLYSEMTKSGFELLPPDDPDPEEDLHSVMIYEQDVDLTPTSVRHYVMGLVSSNTGTSEDDIINTTKKAWKYCFGWQEFVALDSLSPDTPASYPYYAIGSHEGGLNAGCCGCDVTKVSGAPELTLGGSGCEGTIEFAGGTGCGTPYEATFRLQDLCGDYTDDCVVRIDISGECLCDCPNQCDYDGDTFLTALDLGSLIDVLFAGKPEEQDPLCPTSRGDFDCDGFPTALDLGGLIDHLFAGGAGPCLPCDVL